MAKKIVVAKRPAEVKPRSSNVTNGSVFLSPHSFWTSSFFGHIPSNTEGIGTGMTCQPDDFDKFRFPTVCHYVKNHSELCDGGGYLHWTEYAFCSTSDSSSSLPRLLVLLSSVLFFVLLFVHLSITADSFFCKNIAAIIAGVTFMAFGNGAPDIFSSIASVISAKRSRADLAISELLGGGMFVTTCVISLIALSRPFHLMRRPILRDIFFYLLALSLLIFISFSSRTINLWHPCAFLLLYLVYASLVVISNLMRHRLRPSERRRRMHKTISRFSLLVPPKSNCKSSNKVAPINRRSDQEGENTTTDRPKSIKTPQSIEIGTTPGARPMGVISVIELPTGALVIPANHFNENCAKTNEKMEEHDEEESTTAFLEAGKFFAKEELDELSSDEEMEGMGVTPAVSDRITTPCASSSAPSTMTSSFSCKRVDSALREAAVAQCEELKRAISSLWPVSSQRFRQSTWQTRMFLIAKVPSLLLLRLTVPCASQPWSKPISTIHAFLAPLVFCAAFQCLKKPLSILPPFVLGELALLLSLLFSLFVLCSTKLQGEPTYYKRCAAYFGFGMSIAWIYATASEVMNVVLLFGTISGIPHKILGLTAIAWANSIGDLIADVSVARQGMPRMAFSAAIGAPLFNLMVGFGATFMIAELQGKVIIIEPDPVTLVMFVFLTLSLLCTLLLLLLQKFFVRQLHGFVLLVLYAIFLILAILASQGLLS